jgi:hypothetical protein
MGADQYFLIGMQADAPSRFAAAGNFLPDNTVFRDGSLVFDSEAWLLRPNPENEFLKSVAKMNCSSISRELDNVIFALHNERSCSSSWPF